MMERTPKSLPTTLDASAIGSLRATPGVLVIEPPARLLYLNDEAERLLTGGAPISRIGFPRIPAAVLHLCRQLLRPDRDPPPQRVSGVFGDHHIARVSWVNNVETRKFSTQILVLIEPIGKHYRLNLQTAKSRFRLTPREIDIITQMIRGLDSQQVAEQLLISLGTLKVHLKHIMKKMKVTHRQGIIANLVDHLR